MRSKLLHEVDGLRTYAVVFDKGDEVKSVLEEFARDHNVTAASLTGIGALEQAALAYFDRETKQYQDIPVSGQAELLSLVGDIAVDTTGDSERAVVHAHVVIAHTDGTTRGGHLKSAVVWPTLEMFVVETPAHLRKTHDAETGLALIDLD